MLVDGSSEVWTLSKMASAESLKLVLEVGSSDVTKRRLSLYHGIAYLPI